MEDEVGSNVGIPRKPGILARNIWVGNTSNFKTWVSKVRRDIRKLPNVGLTIKWGGEEGVSEEVGDLEVECRVLIMGRGGISRGWGMGWVLLGVY